MEAELRSLGMSPRTYLRQVRKQAKQWDYDPRNFTFSDREGFKIMSLNPRRHFGRIGYGDFIIWTFLERRGDVEEGEAERRRERFWKSHSKIKGDWKKDDYSPNNLALRILW
jgi:hypothetical protein